MGLSNSSVVLNSHMSNRQLWVWLVVQHELPLYSIKHGGTTWLMWLQKMVVRLVLLYVDVAMKLCVWCLQETLMNLVGLIVNLIIIPTVASSQS